MRVNSKNLKKLMDYLKRNADIKSNNNKDSKPSKLKRTTK